MATPTSSKLSQIHAKSLNDLGFNLLASLEGNNVLISPLSIASCLSLAAAGATKGSDADKEFRTVLPDTIPLHQTADQNITLHIANAAWVSAIVKPSYIEAIKKLRSEVKPLPKSVDEVNHWVSQQTRGKISNLMNSLPSPLVALLINAVYFKADWAVQFDKKFSTKGGFQGAPDVYMMNMRDTKFAYATPDIAGQKAQIVEMEYGNGEFGAVIVLPASGVSLDSIVQELNVGGSPKWNDWMSSLASRKIQLLSVPKFKQSYGVSSLKESLYKLGIRHAFDSPKGGPAFLEMAEGPEARNVYVSDILHKATLEVTEEGSVATAATAAIMMLRSMPIMPVQMIVNRPFLFAIRQRESGAIAFLSRVDVPTPV